MSAFYAVDLGKHVWRCEECGHVGLDLSTRDMARQEFERHDKEHHSAPLSPAAREAIEWLIGRLQDNSSKPERYNLGTFIADGLPAEPQATAEPLSPTPEGDGTGEAVSDDLGASSAAEIIDDLTRDRDETKALWLDTLDELNAQYRRAADFRRQRNEAWTELDVLRKEVTRLHAERDEARLLADVAAEPFKNALEQMRRERELLVKSSNNPILTYLAAGYDKSIELLESALNAHHERG